jgi:RimJ/RimL family protein N-acetyltransferase
MTPETLYPGRMTGSPLEPEWSTKPTLTGALVELRPFREEDFVGIGEALADPEVLRLTGAMHSPEEEAVDRPLALDERGLQWYRTRNDTTDRLDLAIIDRSTGSCVGEAVLNDFDSDNYSCNFRILIGPRGRDRGLGTEATQLIVTYGLKVLGLHRIELAVYAFNPRARHVYETVGFRHEGVRRDVLRFGEEWIDEIIMSVLATEEMAPGT